MDLTEAIYGRRSVRRFTRSPVSKGLLEELIDAAIQAPSAVNEQPWSFYVLQDPERLDRLSIEVTNYLWRTSSTAGVELHLRETTDDPENHIFHRAPALIVIACHYQCTWAIEDCALAAENLMLAAFGLGLGTCWIGSAVSYLQTVRGRASIGLESHHRAVAPIIVGHPAAAVAPVVRRPADIHWLD